MKKRCKVIIATKDDRTLKVGCLAVSSSIDDKYTILNKETVEAFKDEENCGWIPCDMILEHNGNIEASTNSSSKVDIPLEVLEEFVKMKGDVNSIFIEEWDNMLKGLDHKFHIIPNELTWESIDSLYGLTEGHAYGMAQTSMLNWLKENFSPPIAEKDGVYSKVN